jgi:hypothetical protein
VRPGERIRMGRERAWSGEVGRARRVRPSRPDVYHYRFYLRCMDGLHITDSGTAGNLEQKAIGATGPSASFATACRSTLWWAGHVGPDAIIFSLGRATAAPA